MANRWSTSIVNQSPHTPDNFFNFTPHSPVNVLHSPSTPSHQPSTNNLRANTATPLKTTISLRTPQTEKMKEVQPTSNPFLQQLQQFKFANENKETTNPYTPMVMRKSTRTLGEVRPENSPTFKKRANSEKSLLQNYDDLLYRIKPSETKKETDLPKKVPDLKLKPKRPSLIPPVSLFKGIKKKSKVSFQDEAEVVEVENWKIFNVDMAKKLRIEASRNRQDLCVLF